eukprot:GGOE01042751.1.p1 GENE.GGOE01042751.1~~GGOE01042751.1.p1  ORF type:complete len:453 (+),score=170.61 GGOE01042751.1:45-1403(+)
MAHWVTKLALGAIVTILMTATGILLKVEDPWIPPLFSGTVEFAPNKSKMSVAELHVRISNQIPIENFGSRAKLSAKATTTVVVLKAAFADYNMSDVAAHFMKDLQPFGVVARVVTQQEVDARHNTFVLSSLAEGLKLIFSIVGHMLAKQTPHSPLTFTPQVTPPRRLAHSLMYSVPAALYVFDNNVYFMVIHMIGPIKFHLFNSIKVLITALLVRTFLKRVLTINQWCSLLMLFIGLIVTQQSEIFHMALQECRTSDSSEDFPATRLFSSPAVLFGFVLVICMASASSFANIWAEYVYKKDDEEEFYLKNIQLYLYGFILNTVVLIVRGGILTSSIWDLGLLTGFTHLTVVIILLQAAYGFMIAHVLKVLDNIANVFAHAAALLLTVVLSSVLFSFHPSLLFFCGCVTIFTAMFLYHNTKESTYIEVNRKNEDVESDTGLLENAGPCEEDGL